MQTPDWVTADDLSGGGTLSREIITYIGGETTTAETRASTELAITTKSLKMTDPSKSTVTTAGVESESDREDARERRRRAREDKLRYEQTRDNDSSKGTARRTNTTIGESEDQSDTLEKRDNRYENRYSSIIKNLQKWLFTLMKHPALRGPVHRSYQTFCGLTL